MSSKNGKNHNLWYLQHGWGFDSSIWKDWISLLPQTDQIITTDRGYFGDPKEVKLGHQKVPIIISHSLGLHLLKDEILKKADYLVIISGFDYFHPDQEHLEKRSKRIIESMIHKLDEDPWKLLSYFYQNCWYPFECPYSIPEKSFNQELLKNDLQFLNTHHLEKDKLKNLKKILILHGDSDRIVNIEIAKRLHRGLDNSMMHIKEKSGHSLLHTDPVWCLQQINEFIKD